MADIYVYKVLSGTIIPDTGVIQSEVQQEYRNAFGQDLVVDPNTPQGMLITAETLARASVADNNAAVANQINPNLAGGVYLDAIMALTGSARSPGTPSVAACTIGGVPLTVIPAGSLIKDGATDELFKSQDAVTIPSGGTISDVMFESVEVGSIAAAPTNLSIIVSAVLGWNSVTNPAAAVPGQSVESDAQARLRRINTLALQGQSLPLAITAGISELHDVKSLTFRENISGSTTTIDGVSMVGHSIYLCIDGGVNTEIAEIIQAKKSAGAAYNNGPGVHESVNVTIPESGQVIAVLFDRPNVIDILVRATVKVPAAVENPVATVKQAILDYANGLLDGEAGLTVGQAVSCFELAGAVNREAPAIYVQNMQTSIVSPLSYSSAEIPIAIYQKARILSDSIDVVVV